MEANNNFDEFFLDVNDDLNKTSDSAQWASRWTKILGNQNPQTRSASGADDWLAIA